MTNRKKLTLGLFGFGCVGKGLYDVLNQTTGIQANIKKICVKHKDKLRPIAMEHFTFDKNELLEDNEIDIIIELIDNADDAFEILEKALQKGKAVVTANKKMIAEHLPEILTLQSKYNKPILYEGASCGSIPIIRNLEEYYDNELLDIVEGIYNGTTNYILSKMFNENRTYADVLKDAQKLGFAESDPTLDVEGYDTKSKVVINNFHAFGVISHPNELFNYGIQNISIHDIRFAKEKNLKIRLLASTKKYDKELVCFVMPQFVDKSNPLYFIEDEYNAVMLQGVFTENQLFKGKGAGAFPTASAVLSDISALTYNYSYEFKKHYQNLDFFINQSKKLKVYFRYKEEKSIEAIQMQNIEVSYKSEDYKYVIGEVNLSNLINNKALKNPDVFIGLLSVK
ncbi:MAG: homoserine dehydrogenase [Bacteroidetes bacterium CG2_30_32_10]|nr:MAG: homoserine dehydrogenase [Bacteroidetes bacterium CG2_30_32_10]